MNKFGILFKSMFKQTYMNYIDYFKTTKKSKIIATVLLVALVILPIIGILGFIGYSASGIFVKLNVLPSFISLIMTASQMIVFFFGLMSFINIMFFAKDSEMLLALPVKDTTIYWAKMLLLYINEIIITTIVLVPTLLLAGIGAIMAGYKITAVYWILFVFNIVITPFLPLLVITLLSFPLMYVLSFFKRNATLTSVMGMILFAVFMAGYMLAIYGIQNSIQNGGEVSQVLTDTITKIGKIVYPNYLLASAMLGEGNMLFNIGIFAIIVVGMVVLSMLISRVMYKRGVTAMNDNVSVKKNKKSNVIAKKKKVIPTLMLREFKSTLRDSSLSLYSFMGILMTPIFVVIMSVFSNMGGGEVESEMMSEAALQFSSLSMSIYLSILLLCGSNYAAAITVSKEREALGMLKSLPVNTKDIIRAKLYFADILIVVGVLITAVLMLIFSKVGIINVILYALAVIVTGLASNAWYIMRDLKKPRLDWITIKEITNKNYGLMIPMFVMLGIGIIYIVAATLLAAYEQMLGIWAWVIFWSIVYLIALIAILVFRVNFLNKASEKFDNIECS